MRSVTARDCDQRDASNAGRGGRARWASGTALSNQLASNMSDEETRFAEMFAPSTSIPDKAAKTFDECPAVSSPKLCSARWPTLPDTASHSVDDHDSRSPDTAKTAAATALPGVARQHPEYLRKEGSRPLQLVLLKLSLYPPVTYASIDLERPARTRHEYSEVSARWVRWATEIVHSLGLGEWNISQKTAKQATEAPGTSDSPCCICAIRMNPTLDSDPISLGETVPDELALHLVPLEQHPLARLAHVTEHPYSRRPVEEHGPLQP